MRGQVGTEVGAGKEETVPNCMGTLNPRYS